MSFVVVPHRSLTHHDRTHAVADYTGAARTPRPVVPGTQGTYDQAVAHCARLNRKAQK